MADVAVVGAGLMGHALALVFALGGHQVSLTDNNPETLQRAPGLMGHRARHLVGRRGGRRNLEPETSVQSGNLYPLPGGDGGGCDPRG